MPRIANPNTFAITTARPESSFSRRRKDHAAHQDKRSCRGSRSASSPPSGSSAPDAGSAYVFEALGPGGRGGRFREPASLRRDRKGDRGCRAGESRGQAHRLLALLGRLLGRRDRRERRVDAPGAGVRFTAQPGRALRERRLDSRARHARAFDAAQDAGEARQRQVAEDLLGRGDQRGRRQDPRDPQGLRSRCHILGRQLEAQQRASVPDAQVRVVLRDEQLRSPGADLPLDHGRRRSQHLGLRRDDEFVQRHAEHEVRDVHRQQCGRSAPGVDAAHAACEGDRREDDRRRPALHAHGGEGRRVHPDPVGHRHCVPVRHALSHLQERLGGQAVHPRPRLRNGQGQGRCHGEVDAGQGRGSLRRAGGAGVQGRRDDGEEPAVDGRLVHGTDAAHDRQRDRSRVLHPPARARQRRRLGRRHQHLPRSRQRAGRDRRRPESRFAAGLLRARDRIVEALGGGVGRRLRVPQEAVRVAGDDGEVGDDGVALDRRHPREERADRPGLEPARDGVLGTRAEQPDARQGDGRGDEEARPAGRHRSVSVGHRRDGGDGAQGRRLPAARVHAVRDVGIGHRVEPVAAVARARDRAALRIADRPRDHACVREEVRLGQGIHDELQDRQARSEQARGAGDRVDPARDQQGHVDDRLHGSIAGAAEAPHEEPEHVRREDAAREGRPVRRRLLRAAVAVLRHAGDQASRLAEPLRDTTEA